MSINIDKFPIIMSCLTYETCGPTISTCSVLYMRHALAKGLRIPTSAFAIIGGA